MGQVKIFGCPRSRRCKHLVQSTKTSSNGLHWACSTSTTCLSRYHLLVLSLVPHQIFTVSACTSRTKFRALTFERVKRESKTTRGKTLILSAAFQTSTSARTARVATFRGSGSWTSLVTSWSTSCGTNSTTSRCNSKILGGSTSASRQVTRSLACMGVTMAHSLKVLASLSGSRTHRPSPIERRSRPSHRQTISVSHQARPTDSEKVLVVVFRIERQMIGFLVQME